MGGTGGASSCARDCACRRWVYCGAGAGVRRAERCRDSSVPGAGTVGRARVGTGREIVGRSWYAIGGVDGGVLKGVEWE
jgi:hypothetical protein